MQRRRRIIWQDTRQGAAFEALLLQTPLPAGSFNFFDTATSLVIEEETTHAHEVSGTF